MSFLIAIAALVGFVWGTIYIVRGSLMVGCLITLLTACCFSHTFLQFDLGPLPLTLDRLALLALCGAFVVHWRLGKTQPKPLTRTEWLLAAFVGVLAVSTFTHEWRVALPDEISPVWRLFFAYLMPLALYWVARQTPASEAQTRLVQASLGLFGVYLAITGLAEVTGQWWAVFPKYIADPAVGIHFGRARGPMVQAACYGTCLAVCFLALCMWRANWGRLGHLAFALSCPVFAAATYFTYTRSAWLETALGILVVLGFGLPTRWRMPVLGVCLMAGLAVGVTKWESFLSFQREQSAYETKKSSEMRVSFAYVSWLMFQDQPLLGCGFGHYRTEVLPYLSDRSTELDLEVIRGYVHHNTLLCILVENGVVGLGLFAALLLSWAWQAFRLWQNRQSPPWVRRQAVLLLAVIATYLFQSISRDVTYTALENMFLFFLAGVTMGLRPQASAAWRAPAALPVTPPFDRRGWRPST